MLLKTGELCACGEDTDPNLVLHAEGRCRLRPARLKEGDEGYVHTEGPAKLERLVDVCSQCGEPREFHAAVLRYVPADTKPVQESIFLICPRAVFTPYR